MRDDFRWQLGHLEDIRRQRADLVEQIRLSRETIEQSQELLNRIDELLAKSRNKL